MIRVLSGGAVQSFLQPLAEGYKADVLIVTTEVAAKLQLEGRPVARVGIGVAVHENAPLPDISNAEAFKRTLLAAKSLTYMDPRIGTSGRHVAEILSQLAIENEVRAKARLGQGGQIAEAVGRGEVELAIHQISEILPVRGVKLAGPLPPELQKYTVYVAVPVAGSAKQGVVSDFITHLGGPQARQRLAQAGYTSLA